MHVHGMPELQYGGCATASVPACPVTGRVRSSSQGQSWTDSCCECCTRLTGRTGGQVKAQGRQQRPQGEGTQGVHSFCLLYRPNQSLDTPKQRAPHPFWQYRLPPVCVQVACCQAVSCPAFVPAGAVGGCQWAGGWLTSTGGRGRLQEGRGGARTDHDDSCWASAPMSKAPAASGTLSLSPAAAPPAQVLAGIKKRREESQVSAPLASPGALGAGSHALQSAPQQPCSSPREPARRLAAAAVPLWPGSPRLPAGCWAVAAVHLCLWPWVQCISPTCSSCPVVEEGGGGSGSAPTGGVLLAATAAGLPGARLGAACRLDVVVCCLPMVVCWWSITVPAGRVMSGMAGGRHRLRQILRQRRGSPHIAPSFVGRASLCRP